MPALAAIQSPPEEQRQKATRLALALAEKGIAATVVECEGQVGGGSLPLRKLPGAGVALQGEPAGLLAALRSRSPAVIALLREGKVVLDVRCVLDLAELATAVAQANVRAVRLESAKIPEQEKEE